MMLSLKSILKGSLIAASLTMSPAFAEAPKAPTKVELEATRVSLNSANAEVLADSLIGVGPAKAEAIVAWRESNGRFEKVEQLLEVKGIGKGTLEKNKTRITL